jgi:hypothetical protein
VRDLLSAGPAELLNLQLEFLLIAVK